jgi:hypothetical protein
LVGGSSLDPKDFATVCNVYSNKAETHFKPKEKTKKKTKK